MTFKDLRQLVQSSSSLQQQQLKLDRLMQRLRGKEFWYWSQSEHKSKDRIYHGNCCFNHIIGLPRKDGKRKPIFDYEYEIYKALVDDGYLNSVTYGGILYPFKCRHL